MRVIGATLGAFAMLAVQTPTPASAVLYDLTADWNDAANPNGPWQFRQGVSLLPAVADWQSITGVAAYNPPSGHIAQPAFSDSGGPGNIRSTPAFFKTVVNPTDDGNAFDWHAGDVITQVTGTAYGGGEGSANIVFAAPNRGTATISGTLWSARTTSLVTNWQLLINGSPVVSNTLTGTTATDENHPETFSLPDVPLNANEQIELLLVSASSFGDIVGVDLSVDLVPVAAPEPMSAWMVMTGLLAIGLRPLTRAK